jgi:hypothetical protein
MLSMAVISLETVSSAASTTINHNSIARFTILSDSAINVVQDNMSPALLMVKRQAGF